LVTFENERYFFIILAILLATSEGHLVKIVVCNRRQRAEFVLSYHVPV